MSKDFIKVNGVVFRKVQDATILELPFNKERKEFLEKANKEWIKVAEEAKKRAGLLLPLINKVTEIEQKNKVKSPRKDKLASYISWVKGYNFEKYIDKAMNEARNITNTELFNKMKDNINDRIKWDASIIRKLDEAKEYLEKWIVKYEKEDALLDEKEARKIAEYALKKWMGVTDISNNIIDWKGWRDLADRFGRMALERMGFGKLFNELAEIEDSIKDKIYKPFRYSVALRKRFKSASEGISFIDKLFEIIMKDWYRKAKEINAYIMKVKKEENIK